MSAHLINNPELETVILRKHTKVDPSKPPVGSKKQTVGNRKEVGSSQHIAKMEREIEEGNVKLPTVPMELRLEIQQGRQKKGWTQQQLAGEISEPVELIKKYENGSIVPVGAVLGKIKRALGIKHGSKVNK